MKRRIFGRRASLWERPSIQLGAGAIVLALSMVGIVAAINAESEDTPAPPHIVASRAAPKPKVVVKADPNAPPTPYEKEAAMTPNELMIRWAPFVAEASQRLKVPQDWIWAVMQQESGGRTLSGENQPITSDQGAMGIMQVLPQAYNDMRAQYALGPDPYDPHDNVIAGTAYLKFLYGKYGNPGMFAAYNDGPGNLEAFLNKDRPLPQETHNYVENISKALGQSAPGLGKLATVTFTRPDGTPFETDAKTVTGVRAAFAGEYAPGVQAVLVMGKKAQGVKEDVAAVRKTLSAHGAKF
jgi:soluble lytic murein transglycosylase-like protein